MSDTKNMNDLINDHRASSEVIAAEKAKRAEISSAINASGIEADEQIKADLATAAQQAEQALADHDRQIKKEEARKAALEAAADRGEGSEEDDMELFMIGAALRRLRGGRKSVEAEARKAQRALEPFLADNHLSLFVADTIDPDAPALVRKRPSDVRDVTDVVILSQTTPTSGYGTLSASGEVSVKVVGNPLIDWEEVKDRLSSTGSDVDVTPQKIVFHSAHWPIPRLSQPSEAAVRHYMEDFGRGWHAHVSGAARVARMKEAGYHQATTTGWNGLFRVQNIDMKVEGGEVLVKVDFIAAAHDDAEFVSPQEIVTNLRELAEIFRQESIGGVTGAGEIVNVSLSEDFEQIHNSVWDAEKFEWNNGRAKRPCTLASSIEIEFHYEPVEEV
jgi:hypothetical protein